MMHIPWWQWLPIHPWRIVASVEAADEIPARMPPNGAVLVGTLSTPKWIAFDCPCRRGHRIMVNLDPRHRPHWRIAKNTRLTLTPSIDVHRESQRCHYFVRNGRIVWAEPERGK